jgi:hypothetical protein
MLDRRSVIVAACVLPVAAALPFESQVPEPNQGWTPELLRVRSGQHLFQKPRGT